MSITATAVGHQPVHGHSPAQIDMVTQWAKLDTTVLTLARGLVNLSKSRTASRVAIEGETMSSRIQNGWRLFAGGAAFLVAVLLGAYSCCGSGVGRVAKTDPVKLCTKNDVDITAVVPPDDVIELSRRMGLDVAVKTAEKGEVLSADVEAELGRAVARIRSEKPNLDAMQILLYHIALSYCGDAITFEQYQELTVLALRSATPSAGSVEPAHLKEFLVEFRTGSDDKDADTELAFSLMKADRVEVAVQGHVTGEFKTDSTNSFRVPLTADMLLSDAIGASTGVEIKPNGNDTWRFDYSVRLTFSNGTTIVRTYPGCVLTQDSRAGRWPIGALN